MNKKYEETDRERYQAHKLDHEEAGKQKSRQQQSERAPNRQQAAEESHPSMGRHAAS